jgi:hypothetical protein
MEKINANEKCSRLIKNNLWRRVFEWPVNNMKYTNYCRNEI